MTIAEVEPARGVTARRWSWGILTQGRGLLGASMVLLVALAGLLAPLLAPYGPTEQLSDANLLRSSPAHWLGTDGVNRDVFSRLLYGIRIDLIVAFVAVPIGAALGTLIGLVSTLHNAADMVAQRTFDVILSFPVLILGIGVTAAMGPGVMTVGTVIVLAELPLFGRLVRTSVLTIRELPYVEASRVIGAGNGWLLRKHILPNSLEPLTVQLGVSMSMAVFIEGALSFLGLGVRAPQPSLGSLIGDGIRNVYESPVYVIGPLVVVAMLVLGLLLMAQAVSAARRG